MLDFPRWKILTILAIVLIAAWFAAPNAVPSMRDSSHGYVPHDTVNLGLDLQGGSHLQLKVDTDSYFREQRQQLMLQIRTELLDARIGYKKVRVEDDAVKVELIDSSKESEAVEAINKADNRLSISWDGPTASVQWNEPALKDMKLKLMDQSIEVIRRRVDETGTREPVIQRQGEDRIILQVPGMHDPERLKEIIGKTAKLALHLALPNVTQMDAERGQVPANAKILRFDQDANGYGGMIAVESLAMLTGERLVDAYAGFDDRNQPVVNFRLDTRGAKKFGDLTTQHVGTPFAIVLDNRVISAPVIREPILGGSGMISGNFTVESANDLALLLRAGALPAPQEIVEERTVGPSLGADSIEAGWKAFLLGVVLVMIFMMATYKRFGIYANLALIVNIILLVSALTVLGATLTLPGIAGIVLTLGMAVDANVLIFERIKEELRLGKTPLAAVEHGFKLAFKTITDANLTTLIAACLLYYFGSGAVKGFAVTLTLGIITSMFSAILFTRMLVATWVRRVRPKTLAI